MAVFQQSLAFLFLFISAAQAFRPNLLTKDNFSRPSSPGGVSYSADARLELPPPVQIFSSPFKMGDIPSPDNWNPQRSPRNKISTQRSPRNLGGLVERVSIDLEDVPVIEGVRVADDPREANIIYRNARIINNVLVPMEESSPPVTPPSSQAISSHLLGFQDSGSPFGTNNQFMGQLSSLANLVFGSSINSVDVDTRPETLKFQKAQSKLFKTLRDNFRTPPPLDFYEGTTKEGRSLPNNDYNHVNLVQIQGRNSFNNRKQFKFPNHANNMKPKQTMSYDSSRSSEIIFPIDKNFETDHSNNNFPRASANSYPSQSNNFGNEFQANSLARPTISTNVRNFQTDHSSNDFPRKSGSKIYQSHKVASGFQSNSLARPTSGFQSDSLARPTIANNNHFTYIPKVDLKKPIISQGVQTLSSLYRRGVPGNVSMRNNRVPRTINIRPRNSRSDDQYPVWSI